MDLILERVQNKFACIIGELCSEPIVLSKFAIWLDLRLAEYKAKGAISLDCLGENPDPIWLKGHEKPLSDSTNITRPYSTSPNQSSSHGGFSYGDQFGHSGENTRPVVFETHDRLSPQIVEVKKESLGNAKEVYPISLHVGGASEKRRDLKRTAFQSDSENFTDSSPSKKWRSSSLQTVTLEETNQSLMSIIGESQDNDEDTVSNSNFQTSFTIPDDQASTSSTSAQPRGDNSSSWSNLQASHSIEEMSMAPQPRQETDVTRRRKLLAKRQPLSAGQRSYPVERKGQLSSSAEPVFSSTDDSTTLELECHDALCREAETTEERLTTMNEKLNGTISIMMQLQYKLDRLSPKPTSVTKRESASQTDEVREITPTIVSTQSPHETHSDNSKDGVDADHNKATEESVPEFTDKRLLNLRPVDLEGQHIDRESLQELVDRLGREQPEDVPLEEKDVLSILSKSQGLGHFAKNLVFRRFTIGQLYGRNACGRNFMLAGRSKKKALNHGKLREILDLISQHFKDEENGEKMAVTAINTGLRYLWNVRLKFHLLNINSLL